MAPSTSLMTPPGRGTGARPEVGLHDRGIALGEGQEVGVVHVTAVGEVLEPRLRLGARAVVHLREDTVPALEVAGRAVEADALRIAKVVVEAVDVVEELRAGLCAVHAPAEGGRLDHREVVVGTARGGRAVLAVAGAVGGLGKVVIEVGAPGARDLVARARGVEVVLVGIDVCEVAEEPVRRAQPREAPGVGKVLRDLGPPHRRAGIVVERLRRHLEHEVAAVEQPPRAGVHHRVVQAPGVLLRHHAPPQPDAIDVGEQHQLSGPLPAPGRPHRLLQRQPRDDRAHGRIGQRRAPHVDQPALGVDVGPHLGSEHGDPAVGLLPLEVGGSPAEAVAAHLAKARHVAGIEAERAGVAPHVAQRHRRRRPPRCAPSGSRAGVPRAAAFRSRARGPGRARRTGRGSRQEPRGRARPGSSHRPGRQRRR